ncbi:MAG: CYTH domain-containing protein, partial [Planctomycetota bacterium]|nr:CYTH domain-containing protein [Planctomycetota bacterium]
VRLAGLACTMTIKGRSVGIARQEFEYPLPLADTEALLALCERPLIEKTRYRIPHAGHIWEVDEFAGMNAGLIIAEVELESEDAKVELPSWVGAEVSHDPRYFNSNLVAKPFTTW